ncbi:hypothetical protein [Tellurirhabdus bombi]|uniref:hypothetical protein n=1 Tax=Tellurirhabdus bombi TaxID=2907205 RepID=UPI001F3737D9|nr:hypothetical protein [Tellurirhabdus bombi]
MKTDKFSDSIRRKLESLQPTYRDQDWARMEKYMQQHAGGGGMPSGTSISRWLVPTAGVMTMMALVATVFWQHGSNQELQQKVQTLSQKVTQLQQTTDQVASRVDTVYITQYIAEKSTQKEAISAANGSSAQPQERLAASENKENRSPIKKPTTENGYEINATTTKNELEIKPAGQWADRSKMRETAFSKDQKVSESADHQAKINLKGPDQLAGGQAGRTELPTKIESTSGNGGSNDRWAATQKNFQLNTLAPRAAMRLDSAYFTEQFERRVRRIRVASLMPKTAVALSGLAPAIEEPQPLIRFRLGAGGELGLQQWGLGLYGEAIIGNHLTLGVGLNRQTKSEEQFMTDNQFDEKTRLNFRKKYANGLGPQHEILNIERSNKIWQLPVSLGYRIAVTDQLAIVPTVGANIGLQVKEQVDFMYRRDPRDPRGFLPVDLKRVCPPELHSGWFLALAVEKQWDHWAVQGSPYISRAWQTDPNGMKSNSIGARMRVLYQF